MTFFDDMQDGGNPRFGVALAETRHRLEVYDRLVLALPGIQDELRSIVERSAVHPMLFDDAGQSAQRILEGLDEVIERVGS